jgi:hypothetical protein
VSITPKEFREIQGEERLGSQKDDKESRKL